MALSDEKYVLFTTFRRNGDAVSTAVWVTDVGGGELGFTTGATSGKVKRLAHTPRVTVQPCDMRGKVKAGSSPVEGTARVATGEDLTHIRARIEAKYGLMAKVMRVTGDLSRRVRRRTLADDTCAVAFTVSS